MVAALNGFNACLLHYGQTGSGKVRNDAESDVGYLIGEWFVVGGVVVV